MASLLHYGYFFFFESHFYHDIHYIVKSIQSLPFTHMNLSDIP